jgi:hypothetical protein
MRPTREEFEKKLLYKTNDQLKKMSDRMYEDFCKIFDIEESPTVKIRKSRTAMNDFRSLFKELRRRIPTA